MPDHYLQTEFLDLIKNDPAVLSFLDSGCLDGMWFWDLDKPENEWLSPRFKEIFGYTEEEMDHSPDWWQENIHPEDLEVALKNFEAHKADPDVPYDQIVRYKHKSGKTVWIRCRGLMIRDKDGIPRRMLGAHTDVTAIKEQELELSRAHDEARAASQAKSEFLANMSHEIRTPLTGIIGMLELVGNSKLSGPQREQIDIARHSASSLLAIINGILDLSKMQAGTMSINKRAFQADQVFSQAVAVMESKSETKGVALETKVRASARRELFGDPDRITQIIYNLVGNAIKFTDSGTVSFKASCEDHDDDDEKVYVKLVVSDTGIGMQEQQIARIFDRFEQLDSGSDKKHQGAGLGLAIVKELVELMDGTIDVKSALNEGTTFTVRILCNVPEGMMQNRDLRTDGFVTASLDVDNMNVLIAEDNPVNQKMIASFADILGLNFTMVASGLEAVSACQTETYDFILMDMQMPEMDGVEATKEIRKLDSHYAKIPIIAVTANVFGDDVKKCKNAGMNDHLAKPFRLYDLRNVLIKKYDNVTAA